jgi:hypothetical protein
VRRPVLIEEFHVGVFVEHGLPKAQYRVIRRALNSVRFQASLQRTVRLVCDRSSALRCVRVTLTR